MKIENLKMKVLSFKIKTKYKVYRKKVNMNMEKKNIMRKITNSKVCNKRLSHKIFYPMVLKKRRR